LKSKKAWVQVLDLGVSARRTAHAGAEKKSCEPCDSSGLRLPCHWITLSTALQARAAVARAAEAENCPLRAEELRTRLLLRQLPSPLTLHRFSQRRSRVPPPQ
jgi:hypothetical protein